MVAFYSYINVYIIFKQNYEKKWKNKSSNKTMVKIKFIIYVEDTYHEINLNIIV